MRTVRSFKPERLSVMLYSDEAVMAMTDGMAY